MNTVHTVLFNWGFYSPHSYIYSNSRKQQEGRNYECRGNEEKKASITSTQELVDDYVESYYQYKFFEDAEYDHEEGTKEYEAACALTDSWSDLMGDLEAKVVKAASEEGLLSANSADQGLIKQLEAFMDKYGYRNTGGWWVKKDI